MIQDVKSLQKELKSRYGGEVFCYDAYDNHSEEEMLNPEYGIKIELCALIDRVKSLEGFRDDIGLKDIVISDEISLGKKIEIEYKGTFDVEWPGDLYPDPEEYRYGVIKGTNQKIICKNGADGRELYYLFSE